MCADAANGKGDAGSAAARETGRIGCVRSRDPVARNRRRRDRAAWPPPALFTHTVWKHATRRAGATNKHAHSGVSAGKRAAASPLPFLTHDGVPRRNFSENGDRRPPNPNDIRRDGDVRGDGMQRL